MGFLIDNIISEVVGRKGYLCYSLNVDDKTVVLVNLPYGQAEEQQEMLDACNIVNSVIESQFGCKLRVVVSDKCISETAMPYTYSDALEALEYVIVNNMFGVFVCSELRWDEEQSYKTESEFRLIYAVCNGEYDAACEALDDIFKDNEKTLTSLAMKCLIIEIVGALIKTVDDVETKAELAKICDFKKTVFDSKKELYLEIKCLCQKNAEEKSKIGSDTAARIKNYIDENYTDNLFSMQLLEEKTGLSRYHMSRTFKSTMGVTILDYVRNMRVNLAVEIIKKNVNISIEEVAAKVGLNDARALTRAFRQNLGITPSEYKKTLI